MGLVYNGFDYYMFCNECKEHFDKRHHDANVIRDLVEAKGWYKIRGTELDYCPRCNTPMKQQKSIFELGDIVTISRMHSGPMIHGIRTYPKCIIYALEEDEELVYYSVDRLHRHHTCFYGDIVEKTGEVPLAELLTHSYDCLRRAGKILVELGVRSC